MEVFRDLIISSRILPAFPTKPFPNSPAPKGHPQYRENSRPSRWQAHPDAHPLASSASSVGPEAWHSSPCHLTLSPASPHALPSSQARALAVPSVWISYLHTSPTLAPLRKPTQLPLSLPSPHLSLASLICPPIQGKPPSCVLSSHSPLHRSHAFPPQPPSSLQEERGRQGSCSPPRPHLEDTWCSAAETHL